MIIEKNQPLKLSNGAVILPSGEIVKAPQHMKMEEEEEGFSLTYESEELKEVLENKIELFSELQNKTLNDIQTTFSRFNAVMLVASLTLWGLNDFGIASLLKTTEEHINSLRNLEVYDQIINNILENVERFNINYVSGYLNNKSLEAAVVIGENLKNNNAKTRIAAAKEILNYSGFESRNAVNKTNVATGIRITILKENETIEKDIKIEEVA